MEATLVSLCGDLTAHLLPADLVSFTSMPEGFTTSDSLPLP
jgi:hypothetical protein